MAAAHPPDAGGRMGSRARARPRRRPPTWSRGRAERATEMPRKPRRSRQLSVGGQGRRLVREKAPRGWRGRGSEETKATFPTHDAGFAKPLGTGPVWAGTKPAQIQNSN